MKLRVRTLGNEEEEFSVSPEDTILQFKEKIQEKWGIDRMPAARQKLVHAGQILVDTKTVSQYAQIKENDKLVVIVSKVTNTAAASSEAANKAATTSNNNTLESQPAAATTATAAVESTNNENNNNSTLPASTDASLLATGEVLQESIRNLVAMGFQLDQVQVAMAAAYNNPDRAVEYLMNGIPENILREMAMSVNEGAMESPVAGGDDAGESPFAESSGVLDALRDHPNFEQMRQLVQANPQVLPQVLQMIGASNPQLLQLITEHQEEFLQLLHEPARETAEGDEGGPGFGVIRISEAEMEALQRLEALGFSRERAAEAYLACDRNEELAANFLFENLNDFQEPSADDNEQTDFM